MCEFCSIFYNLSNRMKSILCLAAFLSVVSASCPSLSGVSSFNLTNFLGTWYQQMSYNNIWFQGIGYCAKTDFSQDSDSGTITVVNSQKSIFGISEEVDGYAILENSTVGQFKMIVQSFFDVEVTTELLVLATDYDNYAILYTCNEVSFVTYPCGWVVTKDKTLSSDTKEAIKEAFTEIVAAGGPAEKKFTTTSQKGC